MSETHTPYAEEEKEDKTFSEELEKFVDALERLYIFDNLSGRLQFREKWPQVATYLFSADLLHIDEVGSTDKAFKQKLEQEADTNRIALLSTIEEMKEQHNNEGALDAATTREFIVKLGRQNSMHIFHEEIVNRFAPTTETEANIQTEGTPAPISHEEPTADLQNTAPTKQLEPEPAAAPKAKNIKPAKPKRGYYKSLFNTAAQRSELDAG